MQRAKIHSLSLFQSETLSRNEIIKQEIIIFFRNNLVSNKLKNKKEKKNKKKEHFYEPYTEFAVKPS